MNIERARFPSLNDEQWQDLLDYLAGPPKNQPRLPKCRACATVGVLDPCRRCATPAQHAKYPSLDPSLTTGQLTRTEKPPSRTTIESLHAWAREHRPDLYDVRGSASGTGSTGDQTPARPRSTKGSSDVERSATRASAEAA